MDLDVIVDDRLLFHSSRCTTMNGDIVFYADAKVLRLSCDHKSKLTIELITRDRENFVGGDDRYDLV